MFITNVWNFWRPPQYFWRLSGDLSENKWNRMKTNEKFIEFIFILFTMYYTCLSVTFLANNVWGKFSYFIFPTESRKFKRVTKKS